MVVWRLVAECPDGEKCGAEVPLDFNLPLAEAVGIQRLREARLHDAYLVIRDELERKGYLPVPKLPSELRDKVI